MSDIDLLSKNAIDVIDKGEFAARLKEGKPLRIKAGFDPSAPDIHLGHTVLLRKLRQFQDLGHKVILIIGDFTATIGDPTGKTVTRPALSSEEVKKNAVTYEKQAFKVLDKDPKKIEVVFNSEWLGKLSLKDFVGSVATQFTLAQIIQRDDFQKRLVENRPISFRELMYPLFQAYDSVMVKADVELGGSDQLFNLLAGRDLQPKMGQKPQVIMTFPLLVGLDGTQKMSKSLGNYIAVNDTAKEMFGKAMSIPDELMPMYYELLTDEKMPAGHPMDAKKKLARSIASYYHGEKAAQQELEEFERVFSRKEIPDHPEELKVAESEIWVVELLKRAGACSSTSDCRRLIEQGAVSVDGEKVTDFNLKLAVKKGALVKAGKKKFFKLISVAAAAFSFLTPAFAANFDPVLEDLLQDRIEKIQRLMAKPAVVDEIRTMVAARTSLTEAQIESLDERWRTSVPGDAYDTEVIQPYMDNACARELLAFREAEPEFKEIFVTGVRGLNVCQTNKTSDFNQADEFWWQEVFARGEGKAYHGDIEYDNSARSQSISLYVPVKDPEGRVIGVCKAVVGLMELADGL